MRLFLIILLAISTNCWAQDYQLKIVPDSLQQHFRTDQVYSDVQQIKDQLRSSIDSLHLAGYYAASIDSSELANYQYIAYAYLGQQIQQINIANGNIEQGIFNKYVSDKELQWTEVEIIKELLLDDYLNQGYINSEVYLSNIRDSGNEISADINVNRGIKYKLDSIIVDGDLRLSSDYLKRYFNLSKGDILTNKSLNRIKTRTNQSNLFTLESQPRFRFKMNEEADLYLSLAEKRGNKLDLIIGLQPNSTLATQNRNLLVTGEGQLELLNPFGGGREISVDYKQLQPESPIIDANVYLPVVIGQRFGARGDFHLEKQDSSFIKLHYSGGVNYQFEGNKHLTIGVEATNSFLQNVDLNYVRQTGLLPPSSDFRQTLYFSKFQNSTLNSIFAPTEGIDYNLFAGVGNRTIEPDAAVLELENETGTDYQAIYDEVNEDKFTVNLEGEVSYFLPVKNSATVLLRNQSAYQYLSTYFVNDLNRIGGINTVRGFDERSILSSAHSITTAEYRLLLNRESFFSVFTDAAFIENQQNNSNNFLLGVGSGLDLSTKAGIFSVNLALGKSKDNPFDLDKTRIHFGYVNVF